MVSHDEWRLVLKLKSRTVLRQYMDFRHETVRSLAKKVGCSPATIGHLSSGARKTCNPKTGKRIEEELGAPPGLLFDPVVSRVSVEGRGAA